VLAEDSAALAQVRAALEADGLAVVGASNASEATTLVAERRPEAVLVDVGPPAPEGWELLRRLCQQGTTRDLPVVAYAEAEAGLRVFRLGPGECLAPSFDAPAVVASARLLLGGREDARARGRTSRRRTGRILDPRPLLAEVRRHVSRESAEANRASL